MVNMHIITTKKNQILKEKEKSKKSKNDIFGNCGGILICCERKTLFVH
jgi:hypothetical protein